MGAAALIAGTGAIIGQLQLVGLAYLVFGYLLWPGARRFPAYAQLAGALESAHGYLREAVKPAAQRRHCNSSGPTPTGWRTRRVPLPRQPCSSRRR
jgi:hypothetical protein